MSLSLRNFHLSWKRNSIKQFWLCVSNCPALNVMNHNLSRSVNIEHVSVEVAVRSTSDSPIKCLQVTLCKIEESKHKRHLRRANSLSRNIQLSSSFNTTRCRVKNVINKKSTYCATSVLLLTSRSQCFQTFDDRHRTPMRNPHFQETPTGLQHHSPSYTFHNPAKISPKSSTQQKTFTTNQKLSLT